MERVFSKILNPKDNGGQAVCLTYTLSKESDGSPVVKEVVLETSCYGTSTSMIALSNLLDSDQLRALANKIDQEKAKM